MPPFAFNNDLATRISTCIKDTPKTARQIAKDLAEDKHIINQHLYKMEDLIKTDDNVPLWSQKSAPNQATEKMLYWSVAFLIMGVCFLDDERPSWTASYLREYWREDIEHHPSDYDRGFYALVATPSIEATIDWGWIASKMPSFLEKDGDHTWGLKPIMEERLDLETAE